MDMEAVMQAAERLRRMRGGMSVEQCRELYGPVHPFRGEDWWIDAIREDRLTLADFALSILPKGKRPVGLQSIPDDSSNTYWRVRRDDVQLLSRHEAAQIAALDGQPVFANEAEAELYLHWERLEKVIMCGD